jgi:CheY-like chemotaxis protein
MNSKKIFCLADDDIDDVKLFCEALCEVDASIICFTVHDGKELLDLLDNSEVPKPDIIFLDVNMPRMNGWECLEKLRQNEAYDNIPVLIYSTSSSQENADLALDLGALCFFSKPYEFSELKKVLEVIANNLGENLLQAISHFNSIRSRKVFSCEE